MTERHRVVARVLRPWASSRARIDLADLRRSFAELADLIAHDVLGAGMDLDDVTLIRLLVLQRPDRTEATVEVRWLTDVGRLEQDIREQLRAAGAAFQDESQVVALMIEAVADALPEIRLRCDDPI